MPASLRLALSLVVASALATPMARPCRASAQQEDAQLRFERANAHLARGLRARGRARERELSLALEAYLGVLQLGTRTRNVIFNTALTLAELGRREEAFNYYSEYLRAFDLTDDERAEGQRRLDAIRPHVAVLRIESDPEGAQVRVGRRDLPVRGATPIELAVPPGTHRVFVTREGYVEATSEATAALATTTRVALELVPQPVPVQIIAPPGGVLTLDGRRIEPGRATAVPPGPHVVRLEVAGAPPVERHFEVNAGDRPLVLELSAPSTAAHITLTVDAPAELFVDDLRVAHGTRFDLALAPGLHRVFLFAPGYTPLERTLSLAPAQTMRLSVDLGVDPDTTGLHTARAILGTFALLGLGASIGLGVHALQLSDEWNRQNEARWNNPQRSAPTIAELNELADRVDDAALLTDIAFGATAVIGIAALVVVLLEPARREESTMSIAAAPTAGSGAVAVLTGRMP